MCAWCEWASVKCVASQADQTPPAAAPPQPRLPNHAPFKPPNYAQAPTTLHSDIDTLHPVQESSHPRKTQPRARRSPNWWFPPSPLLVGGAFSPFPLFGGRAFPPTLFSVAAPSLSPPLGGVASSHLHFLVVVFSYLGWCCLPSRRLSRSGV